MVEIQQKSRELVLTTSHISCMKTRTNSWKINCKQLCRKKIPITFSQGCMSCDATNSHTLPYHVTLPRARRHMLESRKLLPQKYNIALNEQVTLGGTKPHSPRFMMLLILVFTNKHYPWEPQQSLYYSFCTRLVDTPYMAPICEDGSINPVKQVKTCIIWFYWKTVSVSQFTLYRKYIFPGFVTQTGQKIQWLCDTFHSGDVI